MTTKPRLSVELVPSTAWNDNLRSHLSAAEWDRLRRVQYAAAGHVCEVCGGQGSRHPVECHEIWNYDDATHVQRLDGLVALCPACHEVKHLGLARVRGRYDEALAHLMKVNGWSIVEAREHARVAFEVHHRRSAHTWTLDLSWLAK